MKLSRLNKAYRFLINKIRLSFKEKHLGKLRYIYERTGSDELIIVFSGFGGPVRKYNYMKTFTGMRIDRLFILDTFGYRGSYYWYEDGGNKPNVLVSSVIAAIGGGMKRYILLGAAKGALVPYTMG